MALKKTNTQLIYLERLLLRGQINPTEYLQRIEMAYRLAPASFTEDEIDYIAKQFKRVDIDFKRDLEVADATLLSTVNQFVSGLSEGFTTLGWAGEADTSVEGIANKLGHLLGFAPDVVASAFSLGTYLPFATAKRIGTTGHVLTRKAIEGAGKRAPKLLRKKIGPKTFAIQSIPMKVADIVMDNTKKSLGKANVLTSGFMNKGLLGHPKFRNIAEQGAHLGVALGVSAWKEGPKGMAEAGLHGAAAGMVFGTIGNYANISRMLGNPRTEKAAQSIIKGVAKDIVNNEAKLRGVDMLFKGALGGAYTGGMATMNDLPVADQVYEYLLGIFFGATAQSRGFIDRQKWLMNNRITTDLTADLEYVKKGLINDPEFVKLEAYDQQYIKDHIERIQQDRYNQSAPIMGQLNPRITRLMKEMKIKGAPTYEQAKEVLKRNRQEEAVESIDPNNVQINVRPDKKASPVTKVISGAQSLTDITALRTAHKLGYPTGGFITPEFRTEAPREKPYYNNDPLSPGFDKTLAIEKYNLTKTDVPNDYPLRTTKNVDSSDATLAFRYFESTGTDKTIIYALTGNWIRGKYEPMTDKKLYPRYQVFNKNNTGHKPLLVLKNDRFTAENINLIRSFVERNPGVLNVAGPSARDLNSPIKGPILQKAAGNIEKLLTEALKIYKSPNEVSSGRANQLVKSETSLRQEMANQLEIEVDALIDRTADINEPTHIINKEIRHIADLIRGKKVRNKDAILLRLSELAVESEYDINAFIRAIAKEYPDLDKKALSDAYNYNRLGSYLKIKEANSRREDVELDLSIEGEPVVKFMPNKDAMGNDLGNLRPRNKYNHTFGMDHSDKIRIVVRKAYALQKMTQYGTKDNQIKYEFNRVNPLDNGNIPDRTGSVREQRYPPIREVLTTEVIKDIRKAIAKKNRYIYGGAKDSGQLILHRFPIIDETFPSDAGRVTTTELNYFNQKSQRTLLMELNKLGYKFDVSDYAMNKEHVSNIVYLLRESGYIGAERITQKTLLDGMNKYENDPLYENVQKLNKYQHLAQGTDIPLSPEDYTTLLKNTNGEFNMLAVNDVESNFAVQGERSISGTDAVVYASHKNFDITQTKNFRPSQNGFLKLVGYRGPRDGVGNILLKTGTFRATKAMNDFMEANNIHFIVYKSAAKTQVGLKFHDLLYKEQVPGGKEVWSVEGPLETFRMKPDELYLNYGVYENTMKFNRPISLLKQMNDKINAKQIGEKDYEAYKESYSEIVEESLAGKQTENVKFRAAVEGKSTDKDFLDGKFRIEEIGMDEINSIFAPENIGKPFYKTVLKKILEEGQGDFYEEPTEFTNWGGVNNEIFNTTQRTIPDILDILQYDPQALMEVPIMNYVNKVLASYRNKRVTRPTVPHGFEAKLGPRDAEIRILHPELNDESFMLHNEYKDLEIKVRTEDTPMRLEDVWNTFKKLDAKVVDVIKYNAYKEALEFVLGRSPISGNGGVRVLNFVGFVDRKGLGIVTTSKTDYYLGGADKDADSVFAYQNMPEGYKNVFRKYENELRKEQTEKEKIIKGIEDTEDIKSPIGVVSGLIKKPAEAPKQSPNEPDAAYQDKLIKWKREQYQKMLNVDERLHVARMARRGKQNIGHIVNGMVRMQTLYDIIEQQGEGKIEMLGKTKKIQNAQGQWVYPDRTKVEIYLNKTASAKELQIDTYRIVNLMADSADYVQMPYYKQILDAVWQKYFFVNPFDKQHNRLKKNYDQSTRALDGLELIGDLHSTTHNAKKLKNSLYFGQTARDYIEYFGNYNDYYYKVADIIDRYPNFQLNPFDYYKSITLPGSTNYEPYTISKAFTLVLRDHLVKSPFFSDFGLKDSYLTNFEARKDLEFLLENPDIHHKKQQEYLGMSIVERASTEFMRDTLINSKTALDDLSAKAIVVDIVDTAYIFKSFYDSNRHMMRDIIRKNNQITKEFGTHDIKVEDMNNYIELKKEIWKKKYPDIFDNIETLFDFWLMAQPVMSPKSDYQVRQALDVTGVEKQINTLIKKYMDSKGTIPIDDVHLASLLSQKNKAYNKYKPKMDFVLKLYAVSDKNKVAFMKAKREIIQDSIMEIQKRIVEDKSQFDLNEFEFDRGEWTFDLSLRSQSESLQNEEVSVENDQYKLKPISKPIPKDASFIDPAQPSEDIPPFAEKIITKDTTTTTDKIQNTNTVLQTILPQWDWRKFKEGSGAKAITEAADIQMNRTIDILRKNPDAIPRFEELFIEMGIEMNKIGKRLDTLTVKELELFNDVLEERFSARSIIDKTTGKLIRKPKWIEQMLNYKVVSKSLEGFEKLEYARRSTPVIDRYGQIKLMQVSLPTTTLELGRQVIDKFDTFQKIQTSALDRKVDKLFDYLFQDDPNVLKYNLLLQEAGVNMQEYNNGHYTGMKFQSKEEKTMIKEAWLDSKAQLDKLDKLGIKFPLPVEAGKRPQRVSGFKFAERFKNDWDMLRKQLEKSHTDSRWTSHYTLLKENKESVFSITDQKGNIVGVKGQYEPKTAYDKNQLVSTHKDAYSWQQMEKLFLDDVGRINLKRVNLFFKELQKRDAIPQEFINHLLPSMNDYMWIKYQIELTDRVAFLHPKIDLNKGLNSKDKKIIKAEFQRERLKGEFLKNVKVGSIEQGYFARLGHDFIEANIPKLDEWKKNQIEKRLKRTTEPKHLPISLQAEVMFKRMDFKEAKLRLRDHLMQRFERSMGSYMTDGQANAEKQVLDMMSNPFEKGMIGSYVGGNQRSRGPEFMPFYKKDVDAIRLYLKGYFKQYFTNLAGLHSEIALRDADYKNRNDPFWRNWSNYIRDAFTNMMGMSTYKALNLHGIQEKDQAFLKKYVERGMSRKNFKVESWEKDLLDDFDASIQVSPQEQFYILRRNKGKISTSEVEIQKLKQERAEKLVNQINTTGKYGTLYHFTSDETAVKLFTKLDNLFGGRIFGALPKDRVLRSHAITKRIRAISDFEGKWELISLLSHPKTAITNLYGGTVNTISDTGWKAFRHATNPEWMIRNLFDNGRAEFRIIDETGKVSLKKINSKERIQRWMETLGVFDQMFLDMIALDRNFGRKGVRKFWIEFVRRLNSSVKTNDITTKELYDREAQKTLKEVAIDLKVDIPIVELGALPMKWSERKLRGTAFLANYINMYEGVLHPMSKEMPFDSPVLVDYALKGVQASQFMYQATYRPNFANTSMGRVLTRFQPYAWNSIGRRMKLYKDANIAGFSRELHATKKFQRQFTFDLFSLALANIFVGSIFEYALSPPMNWMQDTAQLMFGDKEERDRAFFSQYPSKVLAPLQAVTPPIARYVIPPITSFLNQDFDNFIKFQLATYFPFGRVIRDGMKIVETPSMALDYTTGIPLHRISRMKKDEEEEKRSIEDQLNDITDENTSIIN